MKLEWHPVAPGDGPEISTSLTPAEADELRRLAEDAEVLEVGSAYGFSSVVMALAGGRVTAVDRHSDLKSHGTMLANLAAYAVSSRVDIRLGDSRTVLPQLFAEERRFDLAWVDGGHEAHVVAHDVEWVRKLLRPGGTLAVHDYGEDTCPDVRTVLDRWKVPPRLVDTLAIYGPGEW